MEQVRRFIDGTAEVEFLIDTRISPISVSFPDQKILFPSSCRCLLHLCALRVAATRTRDYISLHCRV